MIIPMKKYSFLVYHRDYEDFLHDLRELGVVHLIERQQDISDDIRGKYQQIDSVEKTIRFLRKREIEKTEASATAEGEKVFSHIAEMQNQLEHHQHSLANIQKEINEILPWGDFSLDLLKQLKDNGIKVRFFVTQTRKYDPSWEEQYPVQVINNTGGNIYFIMVERDQEETDLPAEEVKFPSHSLKELRTTQEEIRKNIQNIDDKFNEYAATSLPSLEKYKNSLLQNVEYEKAVFHTSREAEERLMVVEGWVPNDKEESINNYLEKSAVVYITSEADPEEKVPILLKNKGFAKKFELIGELYSLPKYNELDLTPFFAPFYTLFFGFCLGDAGYGILLAVAALFAGRKVQKELKAVTTLVFYLGLSTLFFGLIGGTLFGINLYETNLPVYSSLQQYFKSEGTDINNLLFYLSLILGGVQIIFGMILKAVNETIQFGWKLALGTIGWITLLVGSVTIVLISKIGGVDMETLKPALYVVLGVSGLLILFLNNLKRNILMNFGIGLWTSYNMVTGIVGDLLSYIRLFALGISSAILGFVFNSLAVSMSGNIPVLSIVFMVIILVIGHSINIFMSGLGSFVHPMRLTFVEFYKNAGFSGGGKKYNPFKKLV